MKIIKIMNNQKPYMFASISRAYLLIEPKGANRFKPTTNIFN